MNNGNKIISLIKLCIYILLTVILIIVSNMRDKKSYSKKTIIENETTKIEESESETEEVVSYDKISKKTIYLTFDDGPSMNIDYLLDILDKYDAKVTFFMVGYSVEERPYLLEEVYERGHSIGMHSYSHDKKIYESIKSFKDDLNKCEKTFKKVLGFVPKIYRLPFGSYNKYLNKENYKLLTKELIKRGYNYYDWNVATGDGSKDVVGYDIYVNAIRGMEEKDTPVILMHDTNQNTMAVIEFILQHGYMNGYKFEGLTKDTEPVRYEP